MHNDTIIEFAKPTGFSPDPLTDILREGARELLATAVAAEVSEFLGAHKHLLDDEGRRRLVRHGFLPEREVMTGIGKVAVKVPRVRDRGTATDGPKIRFSSSLIPPYLRKSKSVEELLPWLYLKGISTGDFSEALAALVGPDAGGLSSSTVTRLKADWWEEYENWRKRDLTGKRYVYFWADGVYFTPRLDDDRQCLLVIIGADEYGDKDVLAIMDGFRENADSWRELLRGLKKRGLTIAPDLATGDGALGFWTALRDVYPTTREQRCWVHKTANVLAAMPKSLQAKAKAGLQDIWMAETRDEAIAAFDAFVETYGVKYERAVKKLTKDRDVLLTFYDFPAEHWKHIRTTNPIESVFATVRNRTRKTKGCLNRKTALAMVYKLMMSAKKKWRKLNSPNRLPEVIQGVEFKDGLPQIQNAA
ncbi:MAG: IS256 family transposase [Shimia sp.]|nr:IS256 family transposase [Shimia sp.]MCP5038573.1 IS256 family transposase [Paracoccaceae bacterium]